jgi:hypothetical protein
LIANTSTGPFTITLPASPTLGSRIVIIDGGGTFYTNNLTLGRNGKKIMGTSSNWICDIDYHIFTLVYYNTITGWIIQ